MSRIRLNLTLDTLRIIRVIMDNPDSRHSAYSISRKLDLGYSAVHFTLRTLTDEWQWLKRTKPDDANRIFYSLTDEGMTRTSRALESIGAIVSPRVFIGMPPPPLSRGGISAST